MKHRFKLDFNGDVDMFAVESEFHNGPECTRCNYYWCEHCEPNRMNEECPGDRYQQMGQLSLFGEDIA